MIWCFLSTVATPSVIALDRALAGGHLGTFIIGDVVLHFLAPLPPAHPWAVRL